MNTNEEIAREARNKISRMISKGNARVLCSDYYMPSEEAMDDVILSAITKATTEAAETRLTAQIINDLESRAAPASTEQQLKNVMWRLLDTSVEMATEHATEAHLFARRDAIALLKFQPQKERRK